VTPHGSAFYSRGRFLAGSELVEDTVVVLKHPSASRLLTIGYRYPAAGDSSVRVQQLLDLVSVLQVPGSGATPATSERPGRTLAECRRHPYWSSCCIGCLNTRG